LDATSVRVLKEEDHERVPVKTCSSAEVSKLDPPAVKRPPARCIAVGAATDLMSSNATCGFDQEHQDDKEEDIRRRDDRAKGDGITEDANDGLLNDDEGNEQEKNDSHLDAPRQQSTIKLFEERIGELNLFKAKHGHVRVPVKQDKSLAIFCQAMRATRRVTTKTTRTLITEDRIKALDELGFDWGGRPRRRPRRSRTA